MTKISIVTPNYNLDRFIAETIESIISQEGNFDLEYIVADGGSTDTSVEIIKKYDVLLKEKKWPVKCHSISFKWFSEKDNGMYDAINKGFSKATGNIFAWLNADDMYQKGALQAAVEIFESHPEISWLKGIVDSIEVDGQFIKTSPLRIYHQDWLVNGVYGSGAYFLEQDTVFWRADLWKKSGPIPVQYRSAGDYWLWMEFAKHAKLWSVKLPISIFRKRSDQLSQDMTLYKTEQKKMRLQNTLVLTVRIFFNMWDRSWAPKKFLEQIYNIVLRQKRKEFYLEKTGNTYVKKPARSFLAF